MYRPVPVRGSILYLVIADLVRGDPDLDPRTDMPLSRAHGDDLWPSKRRHTLELCSYFYSTITYYK